MEGESRYHSAAERLPDGPFPLYVTMSNKVSSDRVHYLLLRRHVQIICLSLRAHRTKGLSGLSPGPWPGRQLLFILLPANLGQGRGFLLLLLFLSFLG